MILGWAAFAGTALWQDAGSRLLVWGLPSTAIVAACVFLPQTRNRPGLWLGAASYAIYLAQVLAIPVALRLTGLLPGPLRDALGFTGEALMVTALAVAAGAAAHAWVEKPLTRRTLAWLGDAAHGSAARRA